MIWTMHAPASLLTIYRARVMPDEKKRNVAVILMEDKTNRRGMLPLGRIRRVGRDHRKEK
jgi:hypothetical protein